MALRIEVKISHEKKSPTKNWRGFQNEETAPQNPSKFEISSLTVSARSQDLIALLVPVIAITWPDEITFEGHRDDDKFQSVQVYIQIEKQKRTKKKKVIS